MHGGRCCDDRRGWSCSSYSFCGSDGCICCDDHHCENANSYWAIGDEANDYASEMQMSGDPW